MRAARSILRHIGLPLVLIFHIWLATQVVPLWRYQMNPDGVGYLSVARKYLDGHFFDAINAYWSPLYSWLLVPLLAVGIHGLLATKVLAVAIGAGVLCVVWWILGNLRLTREARTVTCLTLVPILLYFGMYVTTPDLLVAGAVLFYLGQMTRPNYERWRHSRTLSGALAGVAYLAKAYALPVVFAHFTLVNLIDLARLKGMRKQVLVRAAYGYAAFLIIVGFWAGALSIKYGHLTTGSTGRFNLAWNGPQFRIPHHFGGFVAPPDELAISGWDDATFYDVARWDPLGSDAQREHFRKNRERNYKNIVAINEGFTWLMWPILIGAAVACFSGADPQPRRPTFILLSVLLLYPVGYYFLHVEQRFLMVTCVLLLVLGVFLIGATGNAFDFGPVRRVLASGALCATFLYNPKWDPAAQPWAKAFERYSLFLAAPHQADISQIAGRLAGDMPPRSRVASSDNWGGTLYVSYLLDLAYWGQGKPNHTPEEVLADLEKCEIDYFWVWGDNPAARYPFVNRLPEITGGKVRNLRIYRFIPSSATQPADAGARREIRSTKFEGRINDRMTQ
ncbi:MAG: hypothetical protein ACREIT_11040 [Tepidisphaeraceae bacterium]